MKNLRKWTGILLSIFMLISIIPIQAQGSAKKSPRKDSHTITVQSIDHVTRIAGLDRYETAAKISTAMMAHSDIVVLASGQDYPDALSGIAYAAEKNAPMLLTSKNQLPTVTLAEIQRLGATKVHILGGIGAVSQTVQTQLISAGLNVTRIQGTDRYETSVQIGQAMARVNHKVFLASGLDYADAISVGAAAALSGTPVLLSQNSILPLTTKAALMSWGTEEVTILGGTGAISQGIQDTLEGMGLTVNRIGGLDRYETNYNVNHAYFNDPIKVYVASGQDYPDALTGALLAAKDQTTVVLTEKTQVNPSLIAYITENPINDVVILGGLGVINSIVEDAIEDLIVGTIPVIELLGSNPDSVTVGSKVYADPGVYATDAVDGNITADVNVNYAIELGTIGTYQYEYSVTNSFGNTTSATRTVKVVGRQQASAIPKFQSEMLVPGVMPTSPGSTPALDYYEIAMRQFEQQILPIGMPKTTVWGYGSATEPNAVFNAPSLTIETTVDKPIRIKWINDLIDDNGNYLPHLLPVDQNLHWANPNGMMPDMNGSSPLPYVGPVPIITHVHGAHVVQESDGYPEAWYLPDADNISDDYIKTGTFYDIYKETALSGDLWGNGSVVFDYSNDQKSSTLWYHDHAMGMTRTNVYTGPAGFYMVRDAGGDIVYSDPARTTLGTLPSGSEEIPIAIQDRSFNTDGSLFYPDSREFFDDFDGPYLPNPASDIAPIWNPEFFGDTIIANGKTWPYQEVEPKQYRFRLLNGSQARTLILKMSDGSSFTQIGSDGGFLPEPAELTHMIIGPAERADVIIDFSAFSVGTELILQNVGPDDPFQGFNGFEPADPATTGQVLQFRVIAETSPDTSTPVADLVLPEFTPLGDADVTRKVSLNEDDSALLTDVGPRAALLGTVKDVDGVLMGETQTWMSPITESVNLGDTETWEIYNFTMDAHPIHLHLITFEVLERQEYNTITGEYGAITPPGSWETGYKDTVIAYPGQITRIKAKFDMTGRYVWHCHILEHEDNEMMRPYEVK